MRLLVSQKNTLYDLIEKKGLSPSQFYFEDNTTAFYSQHDTILRYKQTEFFFCFGSNHDSYNSESLISAYSPAISSFFTKRYPDSWSWQQTHFLEWLDYLKREIDSPNKWERLENELKNLHLNSEDEINKFSVHEYEELKVKLLVLKDSIKTIEFLPEQLNAINQKLDHLTEVAKDLSKFDWKSLFIGTIVNIVTQLGVTPANATLLWNTIKKVFSNYFLP